MNKELIERLAFAYCDEIGPVSMCKDPIRFAEVVAVRAIAAVDAERGKEAVAWVIMHDGKCMGFVPTQEAGCVPVFLAPPPAIPEGMALDALSMVIAGALFDFTGYLTTRDSDIEVGAHNVAGPIMELLKEFAAMRNLPLDDAAVLSWQETLIAARDLTPALLPN